MKKVIFILVCLFLIIGGVSYLVSQKGSILSDKEVQVTTSFYPLYFFVHEIVGDKVYVHNITPSGAEPHDYEPTTKDIIQIKRSKLVILNGANLEPWSEKIKEIVKDDQVKIVEVSANLATKQMVEDGEKTLDPHIWLDPVLAKEEAIKVSQAIVSIDPSNKAYYEANTNILIAKLDELDKEFKEGLKNCQQKNVITSHSAFGYLAARYGLKQIAILGISPDQEPTPSNMIAVTKFVKANNVKYIFFETLVSPRLSQTIAKETGAKTLVFNPLEGLTDQEMQNGENYLSIQKQNLQNLKIALQCN